MCFTIVWYESKESSSLIFTLRIPKIYVIKIDIVESVNIKITKKYIVCILGWEEIESIKTPFKYGRTMDSTVVKQEVNMKKIKVSAFFFA